MKIILITDGDWARGNSYQDTFEKLDKYINDNYYRNPDLYDKREVKPEVMIVTDDDTAELDRYGQLLTEGGSWWLKIPLKGKYGPECNYRFDIMQRLKEEDYEAEIEKFVTDNYGKEFDEWCHKQGATCEKCEFYKIETKGKAGPNCKRLWYEKYKKPELDKEKKE